MILLSFSSFTGDPIKIKKYVRGRDSTYKGETEKKDAKCNTKNRTTRRNKRILKHIATAAFSSQKKAFFRTVERADSNTMNTHALVYKWTPNKTTHRTVCPLIKKIKKKEKNNHTVVIAEEKNAVRLRMGSRTIKKIRQRARNTKRKKQNPEAKAPGNSEDTLRWGGIRGSSGDKSNASTQSESGWNQNKS